ncbi:AAA family ATPase [Candidatus Woesearchaeota archaeon]|nr:AAA family ATPase [Candidatus Woesearchaeota archaeon]
MISELNLQNPWWRHKNEIYNDRYVKEALSKKNQILYTFLKKNTILIGPRQVGKTTFLKLFIKDLIEKKIDPKNIFYFSCEPLDNKNDLIELFNTIHELKQEKRTYIFLDEVTLIENWEIALKFFLETDLSKNKIILCTGSSAYFLKKGTERLPGRNIDYELFLPLSFKKYYNTFYKNIISKKLKINNLESFYDKAKELAIELSGLNNALIKYQKTGGFLKPIYENIESNEISAQTYEIYLRWILGDLSKLNKSEKIFKSIIKGVIKIYSSSFSLNALAKEMNIPAHTTVSEYLDFLNTILLLNNLYQVNPNSKTPVFRKNKKAYFKDPFYYSVFKGLTMGKFQDFSQNKSDILLEGVVCEALSRIKQKSYDFSDFLWFFAKKKETDFCININKELIGIELKWQNNIDIKDFNNKHVFKKRILLSKNDLSFDKEFNFLTIPVSIFLMLI